MARKSEETEVALWKGRINRAEGIQKKVWDEWRMAVSLLECKYFDKGRVHLDERVEVNFINWYVNNLVPLVYFRDPWIFVKAKTQDWGGFAETLEKVVNIIWKDQKLKQQFKRVILSALLMPPGWVEVGYTAKFDEDVAKKEENEEKNFVDSLKDIIKGVIGKKEEKTPAEQGILDQNIHEESIFVDWVPSWNILLAPGYQLVSKMPWIVKWEDVAVVDFLANPLYKNKDQVQVVYKDDAPSDGDMIRKVKFTDPLPITETKDDQTTIRLYHIWDRRTRTRKTVSMGCDKYHFNGTWPYDAEGFPFEDLIFEESLPSNQEENITPYPYNCVRPILPQVLEQSNARTQMAAWRRRAAAIIMAQSDMVTEEDMNQIQMSEAVQLIRVSQIAGFQMQQTPPLPQGVFQVDGVIKEDLQMATNMGQIMFQAQEGQRTATQAQIAQSGLQLKISAKQDCVEDLTVRVAKRIIQNAWQFFDRQKVQELTGEIVSETMWPDLPDDIRERRRVINNLHIFIEAGAAAPPKDETVEKKQLLDAISLAGSIAPDRIKKDETIKALYKRFKFEKDLDKLVITNDEDEIKCAMEENELMIGGVPAIVSPNNNHLLHLQEHAKALSIPGIDTTALDTHMLEHAKFGGLLPGAGTPASQVPGAGGPQAGDTGFPKQSTNPEMMRQGVPSAERESANVRDAGPGTSDRARPVGSTIGA